MPSSLPTRKLGAVSLALLAAIGASAACYRFAVRAEDNSSDRIAIGDSVSSAAGEIVDSVEDAPAAQTDVDEARTAMSMEQLKAAIDADNVEARMAAIAVLGDKPKAEALPLLRDILSSGAPDEQIQTLESLRSLAMNQGDADGRIRDVLREAAYHTGNDDVVARTQTTLDDIEGALSMEAARSLPTGDRR